MEGVKEKLKKQIIAVIRIKDRNLAEKVAEELLEVGFEGIELTLSINEAVKVLEKLVQKYPNKLIGMGTIINEEEGIKAIESGAKFIVSPCLVKEVANVCKQKKNLCMLGAATPTEVLEAYQAGCGVVKVFPGDVVGANFIKEIKGPMPYIEMMPSGGVELTNIKEWFDKGAYAVSVGSALYKGITLDKLSVLRDRGKEYLQEVSKSYENIY